ncbi:MAG: hypothetical protein GWP61_11615 [Chloroflexi bacterium]|nr:hypothetical protein [Chloroflexota bacterium]
MHRNLMHFALVLVFLLLVAAVGQAQIDPSPQPGNPIIVPDPPRYAIDAMTTRSLDKMELSALRTPFILTAEEPADSCSDATPLIINPKVPADGSVGNVKNASEAEDDPVLTCMWGSPQRPQGFRTVWYQLLSPVTGRITISTFNSDYDTVLGVFGVAQYEGDQNGANNCNNLISVHCNDDANGFTSQLTFTATEGETYYIEVADWLFGRVGSHLQLSVFLDPVDSSWDLVVPKPAVVPAISRHATAADGNYIYVIGGQTNTGDPDDPDLTEMSRLLLRLDTNTGSWQEKAQMPEAGYANTTAAKVDRYIYLPTGYNGSNFAYDGTHWAYELREENGQPNDFWSKRASIPSGDLPYGKYFAYASAAVPPSQNRYYLTGGLSSMATSLPPIPTAESEVLVNDTTFSYTPRPNEAWLKLDPMQAGRYAHTSAWIEGNNLGICVAGGLGVQTDSAGEQLTILHRSTECYQPGGSWRYMGDMNIARYGAGSAVGPDGRWYVFGGITVKDEKLATVLQTEAYDPLNNSWSIMDPSYNLGSYISMPARFWPRGNIIGNNLWVVGGSIFEQNGEEALPVIQKTFIPSQTTLVPISIGKNDDAIIPDDNFEQARLLQFGVPQTRNFDQQRDFFDFYYFNLPADGRVKVNLEVPDDNNFDLAVYDANKDLFSESSNPRNDANECLEVGLFPPRNYIVVSRAFPTESPDKGAYYTVTATLVQPGQPGC